MNIFTMRNFNSINRNMHTAIQGLEEDLERLEAEHERQLSIIHRADDAILELSISKIAVGILRDQLEEIS